MGGPCSIRTWCLTRRGDTQTHGVNARCVQRHLEPRSNGAASQGRQRVPPAPKAGKRHQWIQPRVSKGTQPCAPCDFGLVASRTGGEPQSAVLSTQGKGRLGLPTAVFESSGGQGLKRNQVMDFNWVNWNGILEVKHTHFHWVLKKALSLLLKMQS